MASELSRVNNVIGMYADPAAETDDWGDDFDLEDGDRTGDGSSESRTGDEGPTSVPSWFIEKEPGKGGAFEFKVEMAESVPVGPPPRTAYQPATAEILPGGDDALRLRSVPPSAFATPMLTHASLVAFPGIGYEVSAVHPSCTRVKELFSRYDATIRRHFDALVRDSGGTIALDERTRSIYNLCGDVDVDRLAKANTDLAADVLLWKLEWATLNNNIAEHAKCMLGLSNIFKAESNYKEALRLVREALSALLRAEDSARSVALATELEYENAVLSRATGSLREAEQALRRAIAHGSVLASKAEETDDLPGPQQRGLWWQLRCKFLLAEIAYDMENLDAAAQFFSEYIVESITRMIGIIAPPRSEDTALGAEYMRYCLFSPRRLALAMWTTLLCLGQMKSFAATTDTAGLASHVALAFGYDDVNTGASQVRSRIKEIAVELREQYDEISKTILQEPEPVQEDLESIPGEPRPMATHQFDYNVGDFGDVGDVIEEDWDTQLERELNITIERCDVDQSTETDGNLTASQAASPSPLADEVSAVPLPDRYGFGERNPSSGRDVASTDRRPHQAFSGWDTGPRQGNLIEVQLRQYLGRVGGAANNLAVQRMFPKPTQPFDGRLMGPREHENFLRRFVRSKDPVLAKKVLRDRFVPFIWQPSPSCKVNLRFDPRDDLDDVTGSHHVLSAAWGLRVLEYVWRAVRSQLPIDVKQGSIRNVILSCFPRVAMVAKRNPSHDARDRQDRLGMLGALLESLRLSREVVTDSGNEAVWFSRAIIFLGMAAATLTPAAKAAVELFQAESRAHCGVRAVVSATLLGKCASAQTEKVNTDSDSFRGSSRTMPPMTAKRSQIPAVLRQSVVDIMHALYWKTKAGFDESSDADSLERLVHADVASGLFLTGSGISPIDGSSIDLTAETELLHISDKKSVEKDDPGTIVDETRRVSSKELIHELQSLWLSLSSSAGLVRAKVSFALAHHSRVNQRDHARAERFLFDGLRSVQAVSLEQGHPHSFFSRLLQVSPISIVSCPLGEAILRSYGNLAVGHSKYRYGIAALEAATDAQLVRNMDKQAYRAAVNEVVESALHNNDWRRSLVLLYNLRTFVHPKNKLRNEFLLLCLRLHQVCFEAGCLEASIVPLRAYSALIYEERLRVLLQRYRRRLAKKARNRKRRRIPGPQLPRLLPGGPSFPRERNSLASFFETPLVTGSLDNTLRQPPTLFDLRARSTSAVVPLSTTRSGNRVLRRLTAFLWPVSVNIVRSRSAGGPSPSGAKGSRVSISHPEEATDSRTRPTANPDTKEHSTLGGVRPADGGQYDEEQRELLRIEAEQEVAADSDRFTVELLRAQTEYARADFNASDQRCKGLLEMQIPRTARYKVFEIMARIRLKRREVTKCLELIDQMEREHVLAGAAHGQPSDQNQDRPSHENQRMSIFRLHESSPEQKFEEKPAVFAPQVTFLRLSALIHGGRLNEALHLADRAIEMCEDHSFWDQGRLHYLRGKALYAMSSPSTPPFQREHEIAQGPKESAQLNLKVTELTMESFETATRYFDAAGDEVCVAKSDFLWARSCIDFLFRTVVLKPGFGGRAMSLRDACELLDRRIVVEDVVEVVYNVINVATTANIPLLLIDSMAALAEIKCIQKQKPALWMLWVSESWKLFSRLFTDAEDFTVVLSELAPVSTLFRLRNICGRLVRLVMCDDHAGSVSDVSRHLRLFEAYVTLQTSIDQKMNLSSSAHKVSRSFGTGQENVESQTVISDDGQSLKSGRESRCSKPERKMTASVQAGLAKLRLTKTHKAHDVRSGKQEGASETPSDATLDKTAERRPAGAFLHILGDEGVALGRQGFSVFINRPRQQVISAVKGTGAVLIPTNFFTNTRTAPGNRLGRDAEMIFPFKPSLGLGAMQILDEVQEIARENESSSDLNIADYESVMELYESRKDDEGADDSADEQDAFVGDSVSRPRGEVYNDNGREEVSRHGSPKSSSVTSNAGRKSRRAYQNKLALLLQAIREELQGGNIQTHGSSQIFGESTAERVWSHMHRIKTETRKYMHGEISMEQLHYRNSDALLGWVHCIPLSRKEWTVPESIGRRLVYVLYAHGVVGYYAVDRGGSIERVAFGGKQITDDSSIASDLAGIFNSNSNRSELRTPTETEKLYLYELVKGFKRDGVWHKNRDSEIVNGMANCVLRAPRLLLSSSSPVHKSRSRPIVLIADLSLQIMPWELFFDHVVIRSHCLLDVIQGLQGEEGQSSGSLMGNEDPAIAATRKITRFISFGPSRREIIDLERTEEARRQQLAFQGLLRLKHMSPNGLITFLGLGGFSDPTALNAVARPTGPLSSPLSQSRKAVRLFGLRISANIGRRNYPHMDFLKVSGLGSATTVDLRQAALVLQPNLNDKEEPQRDMGAYVPVFMFSYADLVDSSDSVFGLRRAVPNCILMFTPAIHMKVLVRHLEDDELAAELARASGRIHNRIFPDVIASARVLVEYVSRFSREKRIPIVVFLGQGLVDVFPRKRTSSADRTRRPVPAAGRLVQLSAGGRGAEYFRRPEVG